MTRGELRDAIVGLLPHEKTGGWLDGDWRSDAAHEKAQTYLLCPEHGHRAVRLLRHLRGDTEDIHWTPCWAGDDAVRHCAVCGVELDLGGLTDYAVDDVLSPDHSPSGEELLQAADSMVDGDSRWARWVEAAEALLGRSRNDPLKVSERT